MLTFSQAQKKDLPVLAKIYAKTYAKEWELWTSKQAKDIVEYRYRKKIRIKVRYNKHIVGVFFSDIKPLYLWNILQDGDVVIDPKYQKQWTGKQLFLHTIGYAKKKFSIVGWDFYTFKNSYQYNRYKRIGFSSSEKWILLSGNIDDVLENLKK